MARDSFQTSDIAIWYRNFPIVTRALITGIIVLSWSAILNFIPYFQMHFDWPLIIYKFQLWRMVTAFLVFPFNLNSLFDFFYLYQDSLELEGTIFKDRPADYAWFITFCSGIVLVLCYFTKVFFLYHTIVMEVVTLWSIYNSEKIMNVMGLFKLKAQYFPFMMMFIQMIVGGATIPRAMIMGYASARLYYYLTVEYPRHGGTRNFVHTPQIFFKIFGRPVRGAYRSSTTGDAQEAGYRVFAKNSSTINEDGTTSSSLSGGRKESYFWGKGKKLN